MNALLHASVPAADSLEVKIRQFDEAIARYEGKRSYRIFSLTVATTNVVCQALLVHLSLARLPDLPVALALAAAAYWVTDLVNGLVHLWMDNNDSYTGPAGPLIAQFHLHHRTPRYRKRPLWAVYFLESGSKVWLAALLPLVLAASPWIPGSVVWFFACFGVFSSLAEVSHYLSHTSRHPLAVWLGRMRILLPHSHLETHHRRDNQGYCFLNGLADPVVDWIARRCYAGYKNGTDLHYARYAPPPGPEGAAR